ncbi:TRAP transporter small permease [Photobacterium sp. DNB23_23_1]
MCQLERYFRFLLTGLIGTVALMQFIQVVTRYVLEVPIMGLEEAMVIPTLWLYMLGAVNASRENTQIRANVLEIFIRTERGHTILALIGEVISFVISAWLTYWAWDYAKYAWRVWKESPTLYIPTFYHEIAVFIGLTLITCYIAIHITKLIRKLSFSSYSVSKV